MPLKDADFHISPQTVYQRSVLSNNDYPGGLVQIFEGGWWCVSLPLWSRERHWISLFTLAPSKAWKVLETQKELVHDPERAVKHAGTLLNPFNVHQGVRQGSDLFQCCSLLIWTPFYTSFTPVRWASSSMDSRRWYHATVIRFISRHWGSCWYVHYMLQDHSIIKKW